MTLVLLLQLVRTGESESFLEFLDDATVSIPVRLTQAKDPTDDDDEE
jgi:hypothetical protein